MTGEIRIEHTWRQKPSLESTVYVLSRIQHANLLKKSHPASTSIDALDAVFGECRLSGNDVLEFGQGEQLNPAERAFVASAFIRGIYEEELLVWQQPPADPLLQDYFRKVWTEEVLGRFVERYTSSGPLPDLFPQSEVPVRRRLAI